MLAPVVQYKIKNRILNILKPSIMTTITVPFKMFPKRLGKIQFKISKKVKQPTMKELFSEGFQDGCNAFAKEMGYQPKK